MAKAKSITLRREEATAYEQLRQWAGRADAARFVLLVFGSRPVVASEPDPQKWFVPSSSSPGDFHVVNIELRVCDCSGWRFKHHCSHLGVADRAALLRYEMAALAGALI
ncbi:MAG TPA: hypothetical protein VJ464_01760 [Blastocatellia bacterium]|nr:hypothetical protein [Blastocatellia bacterium]